MTELQARLMRVPVNRLPLVAEVIEAILDAANDDEAAEDAADLAIIEARKSEPTRPFDEFVAELHAERMALAERELMLA